ncbi:hypothetical protein [Natronorubrum sp. DTA28]|uniref:hypothetical protein n=1 Tax=Natronorubrum sp. DTA28 TaxID=3447019 RepID=UPI003F85EE0D
MRALRSCDFCDAEAVGTFEVLPPELEPTETEQRRIVLCAGCRDQLEDLLEPLLVRAGVGETGQTTETDETAANVDSNGNDDGDSGTVVASANESTQKRGRTSSPNATVSGPETDEPDETAETNETGGTDGTDEAAETDETDADDDSKTASTLEGGITFEQADTSSESGDATADGSPSQQSANRPPKAYGKVIRLLQNREFPMPRAAVENLAAGAYDLESHEVEAVVDHALEEGEFVESRGTLERP